MGWNAQEMDALVERIGDEILTRVQDAPALSGDAGKAPSWAPPQGGYAAALDVMAVGPALTAAALDELCAEAAAAGARAVWTASSWVPRTHRRLAGSGVKAGAVLNFPYGDAAPAAKRSEAETALLAGAAELWTCLHAGAWLSGEVDRAYADMAAVCELGAQAQAAVTVALDAALLRDSELLRAAVAAKLVGASAVHLTAGRAAALGPAGQGASDPAGLARLHAGLGGDLPLAAGMEVSTFPQASRLASAGAVRIGVVSPAAVLSGAPRS